MPPSVWPLCHGPHCPLLPSQEPGRPCPLPLGPHSPDRPWGPPKTSPRVINLGFSALVSNPSDRSPLLLEGSLLCGRAGHEQTRISLWVSNPQLPMPPPTWAMPDLPWRIALPGPGALMASHLGSAFSRVPPTMTTPQTHITPRPPCAPTDTVHP